MDLERDERDRCQKCGVPSLILPSGDRVCAECGRRWRPTEPRKERPTP
jgi:uncharacterized Zn finger protein (UPF0148 family)